jgi:uncharacterized membrane protein YphA (DoxX/SURF4 family)
MAGAIYYLLEWLRAPSACRRNKINRRVNFLRWGLGFSYLWFGALKFFPDLSSAEGLASATIEIMTFGLVTPHISLPLLALWETAIGLALLAGKFQRAAIWSLYFHVAGTLVPLVLLPEQTWTTPLVAASLEGQYIFKNLITVGAALVISAAEGCRLEAAPAECSRTTN